MLNLTPHRIVILADGKHLELPPTGQLARVRTRLIPAGTIEIDGMVVPIAERIYGDVWGLPEIGEPCIISSITALKVTGRPGVFVPDTGATALRNERGYVEAIRRLVKA